MTCENSYIYTNLTNKSWLNPTANRFYAHYTPYRLHYNVGHVVRFSCSPGKYFQRALGMTRGESKCLPDSRWSLEWPMCKGSYLLCLLDFVTSEIYACSKLEYLDLTITNLKSTSCSG